MDTARAWRRLLGGVLLFAAAVTAVHGSGTAQARGAAGTAVVIAVPAGCGARLVRTAAHRRR
ncbi:hypothetical protein ACIF70_12540 [Actinacidiphila glaucinigra]|uniref:hypothetical protein n=1 Tax=Actinacidiphila glaucinigra TaxID=235986 RepID=UPI002DDA6A2D|nr:hypothetical protein [Actinacidiphila glaucinigra]WSD63461.1 hypothetical protein OIE69_33545 [Actinacidiphila glaucinigra]